MSGPLPFEGLRVIDLGSFWAAPYLTCYLGAFGADVVKVESVQRPDGFRFTSTDPVLGERWFDQSLLWQATNLNKRSLTLNFGDPRGRDLLLEMCRTADVIVENYAARVVEQHRIDYAQLREVNPRLIMVRMPGFGLEGPWKDYVGWGNAFEQVAGLSWVTGRSDGSPKTPGGYIDPAVGMHAGSALLAALEHRDQTGEGQLIEVAQIEVGASIAAEQVIRWSATGDVLPRRANRSTSFVPQGVFGGSGDGDQWFALSVRDDADWLSLRELVGDPELTDPALETLSGRIAAQDELEAALRRWGAGRPAQESVDLLVAAGLPAAIVLTPDRAPNDPQLQGTEYFEPLEHPLSGSRLFNRFPMTFSFAQKPPTHRRPAPMLGQHNEEILCSELGLTDEQYGELAELDVVGTIPMALRR